MENIQLKLLLEILRHESWGVLQVRSRFTHKASSLQSGSNKPWVPLAEVSLVLQDAFRDGPTWAGTQLAGNSLKIPLIHLHQVIPQLPKELH